jgi:lysozyme
VGRFSPELVARLQHHEGFRATPYLCPAGKVTVGYGTNLEAHPEYIPWPDIREKVLRRELSGAGLRDILAFRGMKWDRTNDALPALLGELELCHAELLRNCEAYSLLLIQNEEARADVLLNMAFNLGVGGLMSFKNTLNFVVEGDFEAAARGMLASKWAGQVKGRATELAEQMKTGKYSPES